MGEVLLCRRCDRPVRVSREHYETFERMHYVCFHYEFEHSEFDPDEACGATGCPMGDIADYRHAVINTVHGLLEDWKDGTPAYWENQSLPGYLAAFAAWLEDADGYYAQRKRPTPRNGWLVVADALRAATVYE